MDWYQNPIKRHGDFADPFVLRYNGRYYLYGTNPDVRCWSSDDLTHWQAEGPTIAPDTFPDLVPFAPEVVYWNGRFYMYTSPSGHGHYVLASDSPTGPFKKITGNAGHSIDGSVLIDDDGQWYFYWADHSGILGCRMSSPTGFGEPVNTGAFMHGWTEGPMIVKYNDRYHMTYTGNHYLSRGYRINAAVSDDPLSGYEDNERNPVIIHTEGGGVGLGHSSTVLGPDLHTRYIVYHNINPDASRDLNIDPVIIDEEGIYVYGPSRDNQPAPKMPDFCDRFDTEQTQQYWDIYRGEWALRDGYYVSGAAPFRCFGKVSLDRAGVFECHMRANASGNAEYGILIGREDTFNKIALNPGRDEVRLIDGRGKCRAAARLPEDFAHTALHCLRVSYDREGAILYVDGRKQMETLPIVCEGDHIGYFSDGLSISMGYTAYSHGTDAAARDQLYLPVPGGMPLRGRKKIVQRINVSKTAVYAVAIIGDTPFETGADWTVRVDGAGTQAGIRTHRGSRMATMTMRLTRGLHVLEIAPPDNTALSRLELYEAVAADCACEAYAQLGPYGKAYAGNGGMDDCVIEAEMSAEPQSPDGAAGILFRLTEPSEGGEGDDPVLGIDFFIGYCVSLTKDSVVLTKHRYDETVLIQREIGAARDSRRIRIEAVADHIAVFFDEKEDPVISYRDPDPLTHGRAGIRAKDCMVEKAVLRIHEMGGSH